MSNIDQIIKYQSLSVIITSIINHCEGERKTTGCAGCVFLRFCETIADGEIVPLSTIAENMMLIDISERLAAEKRIYFDELRRDKE